VHSEPLNQAIYGSWVAKVPFVRGMTMLWDTLVLGMRTLMYSAEISAPQSGAPESGASQPTSGRSTPPEPGKGSPESAFSAPMAWGSILLAVAIAVGVFFLLPAFLTRLLDQHVHSALLSNLIEGVIRLAFILSYIWGVGFLPDIRRVFQYHGAEHKTIHAYEAGMPLTVEAIRGYTTAHSRCGTAFILVVMVISVLVFAVLGRPTLLLRLISRVVLLPVIVGISYEWLKFSARYHDVIWMQALNAPGLALQKLTTREPDDSMIQVAVAALERVLQEEGLVRAESPTLGAGPA